MNSLRLPLIFQAGMVLQRRKPIHVWGWATDGREIEVEVAGYSVATKAVDGTWSVYLPPMEAARGLTMLVTSGSKTITLADLAIGEVWLASGQSNMEFLLRDDEDGKTFFESENPDIRYFEVPKVSYVGQIHDRDYSQVGFWRKSNNVNNPYFNAIGFYFAQKLNKELDVPVGIINCTWGGTSASVFMAPEYLTGPLASYLERAREAQEKLDPKTELDEYKAFQKKIDSLKIDNSAKNLAPITPNPSMNAMLGEMNRLHLSRFSPFRPSGLYETMLKSVATYSLSGVLWYQGESDVMFADLYYELLGKMIENWRNLWHENLPFLLVQLSAFEQMVEKLDFVPIRVIQEQIACTKPKVWLVCSMDVGMQYDIHPKVKKPVGGRLALQALSKVYGYPVLADSPSVDAYSRNGTEITLRFTHTGEGLVIRGAEPKKLVVTQNGQIITNFSTVIKGNTLTLTSDVFTSDQPVLVNYCWLPFCEANIYNSAGLPVFPFSVLTEPNREQVFG